MPEVDAKLTNMQSEQVEREVDIVVRAARMFSAVTAESIAQAGDNVTLPQLRVLTLASTAASLNNSQVADALGVHISNASRICERLVQAGLLSRRDSPNDRRQVELTLTQAGAQVLDVVTNHRQKVFSRVLTLLSEPQRSALARALTDFTDVAEQQLTFPHASLP